MDIRQLREKSLYYKQIGEELGMDPRTAAKYCGNENETRAKAARPSILDKYTEFIVTRMGEGVTNAVVMQRELRARGYKGRISTLRTFMAPLRDDYGNVPVMRYETAPGEQIQMDWGEFGKIFHQGRTRKLHCFVATLEYSRYMYVEFAISESLATLVDCHRRAFEYFGGFTKTILYDNMPTIVCGSAQRERIIDPRFRELAKMIGFTPRFCRIRRAQTKGKVERGIKYVRYNFWQGLKFTDLDDLNRQARRWLLLEANVRIYGTTHQMPQEMPYEEDPISLVDTVSFAIALDPPRKVSRDCVVSYDSRKYSVPWQYAYKEVAVIKCGTQMRMFLEGELIVKHEKAPEKHSVVMKPEHYAGISQGRHREILGGKQILSPDDFEMVDQRFLKDYENLEGGEF